MKKSNTRPRVLSTPATEPLVKRHRRRFLESKAYRVIYGLFKAGIRHIGTLVDEMLIPDMHRLSRLAGKYSAELRRKGHCISPIINWIGMALDEVANRYSRQVANTRLCPLVT